MNKIYAKLTAVVWLLFLPHLLKSQNIDHQFKPFIKTDPSIHAMGVQSDGKIIVIGEIESVGQVKTPNIVRLNTDGSLDSHYKIPQYKWSSYSMEVDNMNRLYMYRENEQEVMQLTRILSDGLIDEEFNIEESIAFIGSYAIQGDKCVVAKTTLKGGGIYDSYIVRLDDSGNEDESFTVFQKDSTLMYPVVQPDGKIIIHGVRSKKPLLIRLNKNGGLDESFQFDGELKGSMPNIRKVVSQKDGKYIVYGDFSFYDDLPVPGLLRLNADGSFDQNFVLPGPTANAIRTIKSLIQLSSGKYIVVGPSKEDWSVNKIVWLNEDGSLETDINPSTLYKSYYHKGYGEDPQLSFHNGHIILSGSFNKVGDIPAQGIIVFDESGNFISDFNPNIGGKPLIEKIALNNKDMILVGNFTEINGVKATNVAKISLNEGVDSIFCKNIGIGPDRKINSVVFQQDGKILLGGDFTNFNQHDIKGILRLNEDGLIDETFNNSNLPYSSSVYDIHLTNDNTILLAGNFNAYTSSYLPNLLKLDSTGTIKTDFIAKMSAEYANVYNINIFDNRIFVSGLRNDFQGNSYGFIEKLNLNGSIDSTFVIDDLLYPYNPRELTIKENKTILAAGEYYYPHGDNDTNPLIQIDSTGRIVDLYSVGVNGFSNIYEILPATDTTYILAGQFDRINRVSRSGLAMFDLKGRVYNDFRFDLDGEARGVIREDEEHVLVYGSFSRINDFPGFSGIARINITTPRPPSDLLVSVDKALGIRLQWLDSSDYETGFRIYRQSGDSDEYVLIDSVESNVTTYWDQNIDPASTYAYKVLSTGDALTSDFSNTARVTTSEISLPAAPAGLSATLKSGSIYLAWEDKSDNEIGFILERAEGNGFVPIDTVYSSSYTDGQGDLKTEYRYQVKAYNVAGESAYSQEAVYDPQRITAIGEAIEADEKAFPNPSTGIFTVEVETIGLQKSDIRLYNTQGKAIKGLGVEIGNQSIKVDLSAYQEDVYFLMVRTKASPTPKVFRLIRKN